MVYQVIAAVVCLLALLVFILAAKTLINRSWIAGFLRGSVGLLLLVITVLLGLVAEDLFSYRVAENERAILTLSFRQQEPQRYSVELQETGGGYISKTVSGEQWQLNVRMLRWSPLMKAMGLKTGYRLDTLQGRYLALDMDRQSGASVENLSESRHVDVWHWLNAHAETVVSLQAYSATPGFIPLADGAIFEVVPSGTTLIARPLNDVARSALANW